MRHFELNRRRYGPFAALLLAFLLALPMAVFAQTVTGTLTGTVLDATGAVIPGANVELTNSGTSDVRKTVSNGEGYFTFAAVQPGTYSVKVAMKGFKTWEIAGIMMNVGDKRNISNIKLDIGSTEEIVTVEATASQVAVVDSGERSALLSSKDIRNLSLVGRDATELLRVLPGINTYSPDGGLDNKAGYDATIVGIGSGVGRGYNANGSPYRGGTDLVSDGAHVLDPGCNCNATQTINADMVQEVKVQTSNFGADSVKGPVVISAVGKSGGEKYHGDAYLYTRNSIFNANDWLYNNTKTPRPDERYYYPGGSFGGPVKIPGTDFNHNNKLTFWTGYEYYNQMYPFSGGLIQTRVPTVSMRAGNFSLTADDNQSFCTANPGISSCNVPYNPAPTAVDGNGVGTNWAPFANAQIPSTLIDAGGAAIMSMFPDANADPATNSGYNYVTALTQSKNGFMYRGRVDYDFSANTKLYVSYNLQKETGQDPVMIWWTPWMAAPYAGNVTENNTSHTISANFVKVFTPTLTNEAVFSLGYGNFPYNLGNANAVSRSALGYPYQGIYKNGTDQMPAVWDWGNAGYPQLGMYGFLNGTLYSTKMLPSYSDNLTKVWRTHTFKTGFYFEQTGNKQVNPGAYPQGQFSFVSDWSYFWNTYNNHGTNNSVANMLMGYAQDYQETNYIPVNDMAYKTVGFFVNDDWKTTKRLTLQLGLRFDHMGTWYDKGGTGLAVWEPDKFAADLAAGRYEPGLYWTKTDSSLPTSGRTVAPIFVSPRFGLAYDLFGNTKTILRGGFGAYRWRDQYNTFAGALATSLGQASIDIGSVQMSQIDSHAVPAQTGKVNGVWAVNAHDHAQPVTYSYNFTISQAMPFKSILEVAYVGNDSHFLDTSGVDSGSNGNQLGNVNLVPLNAFFAPDPVTGAVRAPGDANNNKDNYRPYCGPVNGQCMGYGRLLVVNHNGWANYNALQVSWNKNTGWITYGLNYTWSKALGINTDADPLNLHNDYGVLNTDRSHVVNANYQIDLGRRFHGDNPFVRGLANGWQFSGITTFQSGPNIQAASPTGFNLSFNPTDSTGNALSNYTQLGTSDYILMPALTCNPTAGLAGNHYVDGSCFSVNSTVGQNGTIQMPYMHAPGYVNTDITLMKNFNIGERQKLQFRVAGFNVFNHPLWSLNNSDALHLTMHQNSSGTWSVSNNPSQPFGYAPIKYGRRVVELALKYSF